MFSRLFLASTALATSVTVLAAQGLGDGTYVHGFIGHSQLQDSDFTGTIGGATQSVDTEFDAGFGLGLAIGKEIPQ